MGVAFEAAYALPGGDQPLTHARIAHAGNWLSGGTVAASSTAAGYFAEAPENSLTNERWRPGSVPATWAYDHGSAVACDYCAIGAHSLGTEGATVAVQYDAGAGWVTLVSVAPTDDMPILFIFAPVTAADWRISVTGAVAEVGVVKFGTALQMPRPIYGGHAPLHLARQVTLRANLSETGEYLGRSQIRTHLAGSFAWEHLTAAWVRANWRPFQTAAAAEPFFIAWRPATFSEVALCQTDQVPVPSNMGIRDLMSVDLQVRGHAYD